MYIINVIKSVFKYKILYVSFYNRKYVERNLTGRNKKIKEYQGRNKTSLLYEQALYK